MAILLFRTISAGFAQDTERATVGCVSVNATSTGFKPTRNTFALHVNGESMIAKHILDNDIVILEHGPEPRHRDMVVALIDGECMGKGLRAENRQILSQG